MSENQQPGEPVAWALYEGDAVLHFTAKQSTRRDWEKDVERPRMVPLSIVPLYAHPRPRVGVTEEMVEAFLSAYAKCELYNGWTFTHRMGVRAGIRAALADSPAPTANGGGEVARG
jgi:hypothetical protein